MNPNLTVFRGTSVGIFGPHPRIKKSVHTPMEGANIFYLDTRIGPFLTPVTIRQSPRSHAAKEPCPNEFVHGLEMKRRRSQPSLMWFLSK